MASKCTWCKDWGDRIGGDEALLDTVATILLAEGPGGLCNPDRRSPDTEPGLAERLGVVAFADVPGAVPG